jgi:peptidoglycan hydrolase CwlO-like protein
MVRRNYNIGEKTPSLANSLTTRAQSRQGIKKRKLVNINSSSDESTMSETDSSGDLWGPERDQFGKRDEFGKFVGKENRNPEVNGPMRKCRVNVKKLKPAKSTITQSSEVLLSPSVSAVVSCRTTSRNTSRNMSSPTILSPTSHVDGRKHSPSPCIIPSTEVVSTPSVSSVTMCSTPTSRNESTDVSAVAILPTSPLLVGFSVDRSSSSHLLPSPVMSSQSSTSVKLCSISTPNSRNSSLPPSHLVGGTDRPSPPVLGRGVLPLPTKTLMANPVCESTPLPSPNVYEAPTVTRGGVSPPSLSTSIFTSPDQSLSNLMVPPPASMIPAPVSVQKEDESILEEKSENNNCRVTVLEVRGKLEMREKDLQESDKKVKMTEKKLEECKKKIEELGKNFKLTEEILEERKKKLEVSEKQLERTDKKLKIVEKQVISLNELVQLMKEEAIE